MFSTQTRLSILGAALALAAVITSPVLAGSCSASTARASADSAPADSSLAVELARSVVGSPRADVYAPTGETVDLTLPVVASRLSN